MSCKVYNSVTVYSYQRCFTKKALFVIGSYRVPVTIGKSLRLGRPQKRPLSKQIERSNKAMY